MMKLTYIKLITLIFSGVALFALSGCGSSGTSSNDTLVGGTPVAPPVVGAPVVTTPYVIEAHHGSTAVVHSHVTPSESGDEHAHEWTQVSGPTVALTTPTEQTTTFVVPHDTTEPIVLKHTVTNVETGHTTETHHTVAPIPATQPPATQPPATQPPATQPPATQPPATQPPATQPPATQPPATQPPAAQPPAATPPAPPWNVVISTHEYVGSGQPASLHASVSGGSGPYTYFWTQSGGPQVTLDQTHDSAPTFTAPSVTTAEDLIFEVLVTNTQDNTTARATETMTVTAPFSVTEIAGPSKTAKPHYEFSVKASGGSGIYTYQWFDDKKPVGSNQNTLSVQSVVYCEDWRPKTFKDAFCDTAGSKDYHYRVEVTDVKINKTITRDKSVTVTSELKPPPGFAPPPIPQPPVTSPPNKPAPIPIPDLNLSVTINADSPITDVETSNLTSTVKGGSLPYTYQWSVISYGDIQPGTEHNPNATFVPQSVLTTAVSAVQLIVTDANNDSVTSGMAAITVSNDFFVEITGTQTIIRGQDIHLTATVHGGHGNYTYEWKHPGHNNTYSTAASITVTPAFYLAGDSVTFLLSVTDLTSHEKVQASIRVMITDP